MLYWLFNGVFPKGLCWDPYKKQWVEFIALGIPSRQAHNGRWPRSTPFILPASSLLCSPVLGHEGGEHPRILGQDSPGNQPGILGARCEVRWAAAAHALLTQLAGLARAAWWVRLGYMAEIITKAGNRSVLPGFNSLSGDPAAFQAADGFKPALKRVCVACSALVKSNPVHKIKANQGSRGMAPTGTRQRCPNGFSSLFMNGHRNMNPAEQRSNQGNQTAATESLGRVLGWPPPCCSLPALCGFASPQLQSISVTLSLALLFLLSALHFQHGSAGKPHPASCSFSNSSTKEIVVPSTA